MLEVKRRTDVMNTLFADRSRTVYNWTWIEILCLQMRMILESVALGCLLANQSAWPKSPKELQKAWHAGDILKELENVLPECYPKPLVEIPPEPGEAPPGVSPGEYRGELVDRPVGDWMTKNEFIEVYGRLGGILHARNPLGRPPKFEEYERNIPIWLGKMMKLLNLHKIAILGDQRMYVVQMHAIAKEEGLDKGDVRVTEFMRLD